MPLAVRYFNPDISGGSDDGLTPASAFETLTSLDAGTVAGGFHVYWRRTAADRWPPVSASNTLTSGGNSQGPNVHEGYGVTPGDGIRFRFLGNLLFSSEHVQVSGFDIFVNQNFGAIMTLADQCLIENSILENSGNGGSGLGLAPACMATNVIIRLTGGAAVGIGINLSSACLLDGVVVDLRQVTAGTGVRAGGNFSNQNFLRNVVVVGPSAGAAGVILVDSLYGATSDDLSILYHCSLTDGEIGVRVQELPSGLGRFAVLNTAMGGVDHGFSNTGGVNGCLTAAGNAFRASVSDWEGVDNMPLARHVSLAAEPFDDPANLDLTLNQTPGGGPDCVGAALPTDPDFDGSDANAADVGAVQDDAR